MKKAISKGKAATPKTLARGIVASEWRSVMQNNGVVNEYWAAPKNELDRVAIVGKAHGVDLIDGYRVEHDTTSNTGMVDVEGREIFEGDYVSTVKALQSASGRQAREWIVRFDPENDKPFLMWQSKSLEGRYQCKTKDLTPAVARQMAIVGNIYGCRVIPAAEYQPADRPADRAVDAPADMSVQSSCDAPRGVAVDVNAVEPRVIQQHQFNTMLLHAEKIANGQKDFVHTLLRELAALDVDERYELADKLINDPAFDCHYGVRRALAKYPFVIEGDECRLRLTADGELEPVDGFNFDVQTSAANDADHAGDAPADNTSIAQNVESTTAAPIIVNPADNAPEPPEIEVIPASEPLSLAPALDVDTAENRMQAFLEYADVKPRSARNYKQGIRAMLAFFAAAGMPTIEHWSKANTKALRQTFIAFRAELESKHSPSTAQLYLVGARRFIQWLAFEGACANFADHVKGVIVSPGHKRDPISAEQAKQLIDSYDGDTVSDKRNRAMAALMVATGLRCIEVSRADVGDIELVQGKFFMRVHGKKRSGKDEVVRVPDQVKALIDEYLTARGIATNGDGDGGIFETALPMFASESNRSKGCRLSTNAISKLIKNGLKSIGIDSRRVTAHSLRHTFVTQALLAGMPDIDVAQACRHKSLNVLNEYRHDLDRIANAAETTVAARIFG